MRWAVLLLAALVGAAQAGQIERADITHAAGRYAVAVDVVLDAPADAVRRVVGDDGQLTRLNPDFVESETLAVHDDRHRRRRIVVHTCVLVFCFDFTAEEEVEIRENGDVVARIDPAASDFRYGHSHWQVTPDGGGRTRVRLDAAREPDFWVPPLIGPWILKRKLRDALIVTMDRLEIIAREEAKRGR